MATKTYKLPKVTQYVKNVGKSVVFASIDAVKSNTSGISDFMDVNSDILKHMYASTTNYRQTIRSAEKSIKNSNLYKAVDAGIKNIIEDAKTGNFYNDRTEEYAMSAIGLDDDFDMEISDGDTSSIASTKVLSDSINNAVGAAAISQNTIVAKSTNLMIKSSTANTKLMMAHMDKISANFSSGMGAVYSAIDKTNQFLNGPLINHLENSRKYYEESIRILKEQQMMAKEMLEMQRNLYKKQENTKESKLDMSMRSSGSVDLSGYLKNIKTNARNWADSQGLSMFNMDMGGGNPYMLLAAAPFRMVMGPLVNRMMSKDFKLAMRSFDKGLTSFFSQLVARMNTARDKGSGFAELIGRIFGIEITKKDGINPSNYQKGAVPFDGITRQAIIEVIPGYLARIEAAVTGNDERHYDSRRGTWKSAKQIQKEYESERSRIVGAANYEIKADTEQLLARVRQENGKAAQELTKSVNNFISKLFEDGGDFRPNMGKGKDAINNPPAWKYYGFKNEKEFDAVMRALSRNTKRNIAGNNMRARQELSRVMEEHELNGGPYRQMFNGTYDVAGTGTGAKHNPTSFAKNNLLSLAKDENGRNVFWYLREILSSIRAKHSKRQKSYIRNTTKRITSNNTIPSSGSGSRESENDSESEGDGQSDDFDWDSITRDREESQTKNQNAVKDWINEKLDKSKVGRMLNGLIGGAGNLIAKPMEYMTKMLNKADEGMFQMMFGNKEYVLRDGTKAESIFQYIIDRVKGSFDELTKSIKEKLGKAFSDYLKPLWEKYGKPVTEEMKNMVGSAKNRVKAAFNRFAEPIREQRRYDQWFRERGGAAAANAAELRNRLAQGDVVGADEFEQAQESAFGRVVTKRGLTMISPGEVIIPASFDKREQRKMLALEKRDKRRILNSIQLHAEGTVDTEKLKQQLQGIYDDNRGKGAKNTAASILGAGAGLLTGFNPLLGAMAGAGLSILSNSENFKKVIFGQEIDGEMKGGIIPDKVQKFFKKAAPDMGDFGIAGGVLGLLTPFGPLGGAAIGAGIGLLKNSEGFKKFIFGDAETGKDGLISRETYDKFMGMVKKAAPNMAVGAVGGALLGPFGLLGNAVMGTSLGLLSSTDQFKNFIFGNKENGRKGSLLGAIQRGILNPAKEKLLLIFDDLKEYSKKHVLEPLKRFWDPFKQMMKNMVSNTMNFIKDTINDVFEKTIGIPIADFLQEKIFKPLTKTFFNILKAPLNLAKGVIAAPMHLLGFTGDNIRANQIRKGTANDMTAADRRKWMQEHPARNFMQRAMNLRAAKKYGISFDERDSVIENMGIDQLRDMESKLAGNLDSFESLQKQTGRARKAVGEEISSFFNDTDENGTLRYDKVKYKEVKKRLARLAADGDFEAVEEWIKDSDLSNAEKKDLRKKLKPLIDKAKRANDAMSAGRGSQDDLNAALEQAFGRKMNRKGKRNLLESIRTELKFKGQEKDSEEDIEEESVEATTDLTDATKALKEAYDKHTKELINTLTETNKFLDKLTGKHHEQNANSGLLNLPSTRDGQLFLPEGETVNADDVENAAESAEGGFFKKKMLSMVSAGERIIPASLSKLFKGQDEDSKEAKEAREREEANRRIEEKEVKETEKTNSILTKLHDKFFGNKDDDKKDGLGVLSKLGSGFGKLMKFMGVGGKAALAIGGISLFGHASEWFKTKVWPIMKTGLFGTDGSGGMIGGMVTKVKTWFESGGFQKLLSDKIIPSFITGLSYTMENVVGPAIALLVKHLPSIVWGLAKGLFKGLKSLVFKDKMDGQEEKEMLAASGLANSNQFLSDFSKMNGQRTKALEANMSSEMKKALSASSAGNSIAYGNSSSLTSGLGSGESKSAVDYTTNTSSTVTNNYITQNADKFGEGELENPNETLTEQAPGIMGLLGRRKNTNIVRYDENGNVLTMYDTRNTQESALSAAAKTAGLSFRKGLLTGKGTNKAVNAIANMKWAKPKAGIVGNIVGGTKNTLKVGAKGINSAGNLGNKIHDKLYGSIIDDSREASGLNEWFRTHGGEAAAEYAESRNADIVKSATREAAEQAAETGAKKGIINNLKGAWNKTIGDKMANSSSKILKGAAENVAEKGVVKGLVSTATTKAKDGIKSVAKAAGDAIDGSAITKGLKEVFERIAGSAVVEKICGFAKKILKKAVDPSVVQDAIRVIGTQIAEKCAKGAAKTAIKEATEQIANACTLGLGTIAFFIADFLYGYNNAYTMLGVAKGSEFNVNIGHKCACGLVHAIVNLIPFVGGFIPTNVLMQLIMEKILPIFGYDPSALQAAQEESSKILDEWNKAHPDEQYDNLEDFNNKDKWTTKAGKWIKDKTTKAGSWIKDKATAAGSWIKDKATTAGDWIKDKASQGKELVTKGFTAIADKTKEIAGNVTDIGGFIKTVTTNVIKSATDPEYQWDIDSVIKEDDPLGGAKKTIYQVLKIPLGIVGVVSMVGKKIFDKVKGFVLNVKDGFTDAWGDISNVTKGQYTVFSKDYWKFNDSGEDGENPLGTISKIASTMLKVISIPHSMIGYVGSKIWQGLKALTNKAKEGALDASSDINAVKQGQYTVFSGQYWKSDNEDPENPLSTMGSIFGFITRLFNAPQAMMGYVGTKIKAGFDALVSGAKEGALDASSDINAVKQGQYTIFSGQYWKSDNMDDGNPLSKIGSIFSFITRLFNAPQAMMGYIGTKIKAGFNAIVSGAKEGALDASADINAVKQGQYTIFSGDYWKSDNMDDGNPLSKIGSISAFLTRLFNAPQAMMGYVGTKIKAGFDAIISGAKEGALDASADIEAVKKGEYTIFSKDYWKSDAEDDGNPLSKIGSISAFMTRLFNAPQAMIGYVMTKVKEVFTNIVDGAKELDKENDKVIQNAKDGKISVFSKDYWKMPDDNNNPLGLVGTISSFITRLVQAPIVIFTKVFNKIKEKFDDIKGWFSKLFGEDAEEVDSGSGKGKGKGKGFGFGRISQLDPSIARLPYNGHTIGEAGCGPVAATNLINNIRGNSVSVEQAADYATSMGFKSKTDGTDPRYMSSILTASGIPNARVNGSGEIRSSLRDGNPVVIMGKGNSSSSPYGTQSPHFITAMGYDRNGNVIVDDPYENGYKSYKESDVMRGVMNSVSAKRNRGFGKVIRKGFGKYFRFGMSRSATNPDDVMHQNLGSWSPMTVEEMDSWINIYCANKPNSSFKGNGKVFIDAANKTGLDPRYILAHAAIESGWGTSTISKDKNNYFGIGAFDASPYQSAYSFGSGVAAGIIGGAEWIRKNYYDSSYKQTTLYKMRFNNGIHQYATDPNWAKNIATIMANCPVPNTKITYDESQVSWESIDTSGSGSTSTTLMSAFTELGTSMIKSLYGEDAYNALYGNNTTQSNTPTGDSTASGNIGAFLNSVGGTEAKEYGPASGTQCVELPNYYAKHVLGADQRGGNGDGKDYARGISNRFPDIFSFYDSNNTPKAGDIVSLKGNQTQYGHAAIVKSVSGNTVNLLEQWENSGTVREASYELPGTGTRELLGIARPKTGFGKGGYGKIGNANRGTATAALISNSNYADSSSRAVTTTQPSAAVDYATFLQTIVTILMNISDNTALLTKVIEILSNNFDIDINKSDIESATANTKAQTEAALHELVKRSSGNNVNVSKLLNNKDTEYIISAMRAIATE